MHISFHKMHGLGNDFVIIDNRSKSLLLSAEQRRFLADRRRGVGCDQLILLEPSTGGDIFMRIFNPDGSEAGACGNATRCVASLIMGETGRAACTVETIAGLLHCTSGDKNGDITVDMGRPGLEWHEIPLSKQCDTLSLPLEGAPVAVSMGNPHCVYVCEDADAVAVDKLGPKVEHHPLFPERTNVEYVSMQGDNHIRMRVWERGAGITQACGTGACAAAVAVLRRGLADRARPVRVTLDGGDLEIFWRAGDDRVLMTGPVAYIFKGDISLS